MSCSVKESVEIALPPLRNQEVGSLLGFFLGAGHLPTEFHERLSLSLLKHKLYSGSMCSNPGFGLGVGDLGGGLCP